MLLLDEDTCVLGCFRDRGSRQRIAASGRNEKWLRIHGLLGESQGNVSEFHTELRKKNFWVRLNLPALSKSLQKLSLKMMTFVGKNKKTCQKLRTDLPLQCN